ncbi:MAG: hypothetical protein AUI36_39260 [Cyanobacteria bacterium 13_1_40CM_2_61_4]|nr:MAG: hypothetical protein AUI36_39260 [Cyanobacteria bacterium 13_1_40CM_2_61_4]
MGVDRVAQIVQDLGEARAISDHLERSLFRVEQRFRSFTLFVSRSKLAGPQRDLSIKFICNPLLFAGDFRRHVPHRIPSLRPSTDHWSDVFRHAEKIVRSESKSDIESVWPCEISRAVASGR